MYCPIGCCLRNFAPICLFLNLLQSSFSASVIFCLNFLANLDKFLLFNIHPHLYPLPSRERKIEEDLLPSRERRIEEDPLPSRERKIEEYHLLSRERMLMQSRFVGYFRIALRSKRIPFPSFTTSSKLRCASPYSGFISSAF
jgi:hypothetical protein